jgi:uroporphyrin-3 C-methyltransferase
MEENQTHPASSRFPTFLLTLCLIGIFFVALGGGYLFLRINTLHQRISHLDKEVFQQDQDIATTQSAVQSLTQPQEKRARALSEAEYLVKLAGLDLDFEGNIPLAIHLLKTADQQLADLNDPTLNNVRQALLEDITSLEGAPTLDLSGLILKINAISQEVNQLPLIAQTIKPTAKTPATSTESVAQQAMWRRGLDSVGSAFKDMVIVRRIDRPVEPLLLPEQRTYLLLNIQLKLSQAQWAVLHQQPEIYRQNLQQARVWIQQYFVQNSSMTQNVIDGLNDLEKINVKPTLPDLTRSLKQIEDFFNPPTVKTTTTPASLNS